MPRDNTIKVYRSTGLTAPPAFSSNQAVGATFGELAFVDGLTSLYMGRSDGSVVWIGAEVTGGDIEQGLEYAVPTMKSIKTYVDSQVIKVSSGYFIVSGEDGLTHQIDLTDTLTLTGGLGIDVVKGSDDDTIIFRGVTASPSLYGVVKINPTGALTHDSSGLNIITDTTLWRLRDEKGVIDDIGYNNILTITGGVGVDFVRTGTDTFAVQGITATTSTLGVASFDPNDFSVLNGVVSLTDGAFLSINGDDLTTVTIPFSTPSNWDIRGQGPLSTSVSLAGQRRILDIDVGLASTSATGVASFNNVDFSVGSTGHVSISSTLTLLSIRDSQNTTDTITKGNTLTITGGPGVFTVRSGTDTIAVRGVTATASTLGVASFPATYFDISSGVVSLTAAYQVTGDTVTGPNAAITVTKSGRTATIDARLATDSLTGVARFSSSYFSVTDGLVTLASAYQVTGDTVTGPNASLVISKSGNTVTLDNRLASTSLTGVASFSSTYFSVGTDVVGQVKIVMVDGGTFT